MKFFYCFFLFLVSTTGFCQNNIKVLNGYKYIFLPQLVYQDGSSDRFGIRKQVKDQLILSGFNIIEGEKLPAHIQDPCLVSFCTIETTNNGYQAVSDYVYLKFLNCQKEVIYSSQGATGAVVMSIQSGWRNAVKKAMSDFNKFSYRFDDKETYEANFMKSLPVVEKVSDDEESLKQYWASNNINTLEGIYKSLQNEATQHYKIGIKKHNGKLAAIILESDSKAWKPGEIKAYFESTSVSNIFSVKWLMGDKNSIETFAAVENTILLSIDLKNPETGEDTPIKFIKIYPTVEATAAPKNSLSTGSGFFISNDGVIATNSHVIGNSKKIEVLISQDGKQTAMYKANVLLQDKVNDIALLKIEDSNFKTFSSIPYRILNKSSIGEKVFTIGYPLSSVMGSNFKVSDGIVSAQSGIEDDIRFLQVTVPLQPGNSGGPLFNKDGDIIGITSAKLNGEAIGVGIENVNYAVKSSYLLSLYSMTSNPNELNKISRISSKELEQQVQQLKNFVCLIKAY